MTCPDCNGERGRWVKRRSGPGHNRIISQMTVWEPCRGCGGAGTAHCCDGPVGSADDITNTGGSDAQQAA